MKLIDIGVNLMAPSYDRDREGVIEAAARAGVSPLVITGSDEQSSRNALVYAAGYNGQKPGKELKALYATAGVHPHQAKTCGKGTVDTLRQLAVEMGAVAIGECGLDYNRDFSPREVQRKWFIKQIELAAELSLPLFLHGRDAFDDFSGILREYAGAVSAMVVHCFTGTGEELAACLSLGCHIGITGWICDERRGRHLGELVKMIPPDKLMVETDGPYLLPRDLPVKVRGKRNESRFLPHIAAAIAGHLGKDPRQLAAETFANTKKFFALQEGR
jgi:TatD DNase family protein